MIRGARAPEGAAAQAREALEAVIWRHLPARDPGAAGRVDVILTAADVFAERGSARARQALGEMWRHLSPQSPVPAGDAVLAAADVYAAVSIAERLGALESRSRQAERRRELARAVPQRTLSPCGTRNAAEWHRRHDEALDEACREAESRHQRDGHRRRGAMRAAA
jgi:hypothetical protein